MKNVKFHVQYPHMHCIKVNAEADVVIYYEC